VVALTRVFPRRPALAGQRTARRRLLVRRADRLERSRPGRRKKLRLLLHSNADFPSRIRMFSENLRLHEALAKLDAKDRRVQAALAATQANWHASRKAWPEAVAAFDRLAAADPQGPEAWLRTPGLLRLATALLHQNRPSVAATLLQGGAKRRTAEGIAVIELTRDGIVSDPATGELLDPLRALVNERLAKKPRDAGLLELRAELGGQWSDAQAQVADYTAAIDAIAPQKHEVAAVDLKRLYRRRGNAYASLKKWPETLDDYAHVATDTSQTTDADLLSNRARAYEALKNWDASAADWSRAASGNPDGARLLGEFARRLAAVGQRPLAKAQFEKSEALYERSLREDPENDMGAAELAQLLFDKESNESRTRWTVLEPSEMKSKGGATLTKLPDESILASGKNLLGDAYTIVATTQVTQISVIRLEALPHESLPNQGPGRSEQTHGNVDMVSFKIAAHIPGTQPRPIEVSRVAADQYLYEMTANHWIISGGQGRSHTAVYLAKQPVDCKDGTRLEFQMEFLAMAEWPFQNLGRFRLSVSSDPAAFVREQTRFAAMKLTDPSAKLAVAYAVNGRNDEALRYFTRALERSEGREARRPILELAVHFGDLIPALIERQPDEPQLQLALARSLAKRGKQRLAEKSRRAGTTAQAELEKSREILARLRAKYPEPVWTVLKPTELKSERGQTRTLQGDGSIRASGTNPDRDTYTLTAPIASGTFGIHPAIVPLGEDTYTLTAPIASGTVAGLRLETIPDDRLKGDASRWWGEFFLTEIDLAIEAASGGTDRPLAITDGVADFSGTMTPWRAHSTTMIRPPGAFGRDTPNHTPQFSSVRLCWPTQQETSG
jgi:tetratricopeptide (TPR) repeat protein